MNRNPFQGVHRSSFIVPKRRLRIRLIDEVRNADAGQSIEPVGREIEAAEEIEGDAGEIVAAGGREVGRVAAGGGAGAVDVAHAPRR